MIKTAKIFLVILLLCTGKAYSQHVYQIRADSVRIYNVCDTAELIIENRTRGVAGYLYNKGNGRTEFRRIRLETVGNNQIAITGQDTLNLSSLSGIGGVDTIYRSGDNILYVKKGVTYTINAPVVQTGSFVQNQSAAIQSANFNIGGFGAFAKNGSNAFQASLQFTNLAMSRGVNMQLNGDATPGLATWIHDGTNWVKRQEYGAGGDAVFYGALGNIRLAAGADIRMDRPGANYITASDATGLLSFRTGGDNVRMTIASNGPVATTSTFSIGSIPALGTAASTFLTTNAGVVYSRTPAQVLGDIGAAPLLGSANYIQNTTSQQAASNFWISGQAIASNYQIRKNGSNAINGSITMYNAAATRGVNFQINADTNPGLTTWITDAGGAWIKRSEITSAGEIDFFGNVGTTGSLTLGSISALGSAAGTYLTHTGGLVQSRTAAQVLADIGGASANIPLSAVLANGNTANNSIVIGSAGNTAAHLYRVIRNIGNADHAGFIAISGAPAGAPGMGYGLQFVSENAAVGRTIYLPDAGTAPYYSPNGGTSVYEMWHANNHPAGVANNQTGLTGAHVYSNIVTNSAGHLTSVATRALTAADLGAAPSAGSANYINNNNGTPQAANYRINGIGTIQKDGSNSLLSSYLLFNSAGTRGVNLQLNGDANAGLATWIHNGTAWTKRTETDAVTGVTDIFADGGEGINLNRAISNVASATGGIRFNALNNAAAPVSYAQIWGIIGSNAAGAETGHLGFNTMNAGAMGEKMRLTNSGDLSMVGTLDIGNIPALGSAATLFLTSNAGVVSSRTAAQALADLGAAPNTGSGNYVRNQFGSAQTADGWISGSLRADARMYTPELLGVGTGGASVISNSTTGALQLIGGATGAGSARGAQINLYAGGHTTGLGAMAFYTGAGTGGTLQPERMRITPGGAVGIGTTNPLFDLHVQSATANGIAIQNTTAMAANSGAFLRMYNSGVPSAVDHRLGGFLWGANTTGATYAVGAQVQAASESAWTSGTSHPTYISFQTVSSGVGLSEKLRLNSTGMVVTGNARINGGSVTVPGGNVTLGGAGVTTAYNLDVTRSVSSVNYSARLTVGAAGQAVLTTSNGTAASDKSIYLNFSGDPAYSPNGGTTQHTLWHAGNQPVATTGTANTLAKRDASGAVYATGFFQSSLAALKDNISDFTEPALPLINGLAIKEFTYKADKEHNIHFGILADSSDWHFSTKDHNKFDTNSSLAITIKAMQELSKKNEALEEKVKSLEERLARLEKLLK